VSDYSSQTTGPICIKITLVDRTYHGDCYRLVKIELFTTSPLKGKGKNKGKRGFV